MGQPGVLELEAFARTSRHDRLYVDNGYRCGDSRVVGLSDDPHQKLCAVVALINS